MPYDEAEKYLGPLPKPKKSHKKPELKLFVWEDVFCDYTCGLAVAVAETAEEAINTLCCDKNGKLVDRFAKEELENSPYSEYTLKDCPRVGFMVSGGS